MNSVQGGSITESVWVDFYDGMEASVNFLNARAVCLKKPSTFYPDQYVDFWDTWTRSTQENGFCLMPSLIPSIVRSAISGNAGPAGGDSVEPIVIEDEGKSR